MKKIWLWTLLMSVAITGYAEPTAIWKKVHTDEYGQTFVDTAHMKRLTENPEIVEYGYKYVYTYGVPSLNIPAKGFLQGIHRINCKERTKSLVKSQRFTAKGKAIGESASYDATYFDPILKEFEDTIEVYKFVCKTK